MSKLFRFKGIVATLAQIAADTFAGRIAWASDLARPVHYYTDSDYAVLARKDVAETFPGVKITNQAGPVARMVQAGTDGTQSAVSAATARSTIGAQASLGYTPVNKAGDTMTGGLTLTSLVNSATAGVGIRPKVALADGTDAAQDAATFRATLGVSNTERLDSRIGYADTTTSWFRFAKLSIVSDYSTANCSCVVIDAGLAGNSNKGFVIVYARIRLNGAMSAALTYKDLEIETSGTTPYEFGYVVEQDDATEKRVALYCKTPIYCWPQISFFATQACTFYAITSPITTEPTGIVYATPTDKKVGSVTVTKQAGTGSRMAQFAADGTISALADAAAARATIGAQAALGYTPVNKAGDTMTGGLTLSAGNLNVGAGAIQTAGVTRITNGGAGTLTTLSTTGLATLAQATVSDLTTGRMVSTTTGGRLQTVDAAGSRALIGAAKDNRIVVRDSAAISATTTDATLDTVALGSFCGSGKSVKLSYAFSVNDPLRQPIITLKYAGVTVFAITLTGNQSSIILDMGYFPGPTGNIDFWGVVVNDGTPTYIHASAGNVPANGAGTLTISCKTTSGTTTVSASGSILEF